MTYSWILMKTVVLHSALINGTAGLTISLMTCSETALPIRIGSISLFGEDRRRKQSGARLPWNLTPRRKLASSALGSHNGDISIMFKVFLHTYRRRCKWHTFLLNVSYFGHQRKTKTKTTNKLEKQRLKPMFKFGTSGLHL